MFLKILNTFLILFAVFMGLKQGYAMLAGKSNMMTMFSRWGFNEVGLMINGMVTILAATLILFPKTFVWGNFLMAAGILMIICFQIRESDWKGVAVELPFLLLNIAIIYLQHPFKK